MSLIYTVPQGHCVVVERFGKFSRVQREGLHMKIPFIERIRRVDTWGPAANKVGVFLELSEQQTDTPVRQCHTRDNVTVSANASVYWRILDPRRALYEVDNLPKFVADVALNALRARIGMLELDAVLSERQTLNDQISTELAGTAQKWGVQFNRVEIQELSTTSETATAMRQQMEAERRRRAIVAEAEGQARATIQVAEAEREAAVLRAHGQADALALIAEAESAYVGRLRTTMSPEDAVRVLMAQKCLVGFEAISKTPGSKVFLPSSSHALLLECGEK